MADTRVPKFSCTKDDFMRKLQNNRAHTFTYCINLGFRQLIIFKVWKFSKLMRCACLWRHYAHAQPRTSVRSSGSVDGALHLGSDAQCRRRRWRRGPVAAAVGHPVASAPPSGSVRVWSGGLQWRRRTSWSEPVAPTPSYSAARQEPTSLLTGWASPIWTWVKGPMGRWEINPTGSSHPVWFPSSEPNAIECRQRYPNRISCFDLLQWILIPILGCLIL
jgi:hypothetical protein